MNLRARSTLATLALTAGTALGTALVPVAAHADEVACPAAEELQGSIDAAAAEAAAAKAAFKASNRPLGQLIKSTRAESKDAVKELQRSLGGLRADVRKAQTEEDATAAAAAYDVAQTALRENRHLLDSKRALLAEIKAGRTEARAAWHEAKTALEGLRATAEACEGSETVAEPPAGDATGDETGGGTDTPVEGGA